MDFSGPDAIDNAIKAGLDIDGSPLPEAMLTLYREVMDQEEQRKRSGVRKSMRNRIVRTGAKHFRRRGLAPAAEVHGRGVQRKGHDL